jgi:hypothetical protein
MLTQLKRHKHMVLELSRLVKHVTAMSIREEELEIIACPVSSRLQPSLSGCLKQKQLRTCWMVHEHILLLPIASCSCSAPRTGLGKKNNVTRHAGTSSHARHNPCDALRLGQFAQAEPVELSDLLEYRIAIKGFRNLQLKPCLKTRRIKSVLAVLSSY